MFFECIAKRRENQRVGIHILPTLGESKIHPFKKHFELKEIRWGISSVWVNTNNWIFSRVWNHHQLCCDTCILNVCRLVISKIISGWPMKNTEKEMFFFWRRTIKYIRSNVALGINEQMLECYLFLISTPSPPGIIIKPKLKTKVFSLRARWSFEIIGKWRHYHYYKIVHKNVNF